MLEKDFIKLWIDKIQDGMLKNFPAEFLTAVISKEVDMPGKLLVLGPELFGTYELTDSRGNPFLHTVNFHKIKFFLYANRTTPVKVFAPENEDDYALVVKEYEKHLDSLVSLIEKDFRKNFPESKSFNSVSNQIFSTLNLQRY